MSECISKITRVQICANARQGGRNISLDFQDAGKKLLFQTKLIILESYGWIRVFFNSLIEL